MKKIVISFFLSLFVISSVFAEETLSLQLDRQKVEVWQTFSLHLEVANDGDTQVDKVDIAGLDGFTQVGHSRSTKMFMVNGKTQVSVWIDIALEATKEGEFTIWPAKMQIWKKNVSSNTVKIQVVPMTGLTQDFSEEKDSSDTLYDVKPPQSTFWYNSLFFYGVIILLFIGIFYFVVYYFLDSRELKAPVKKVVAEKRVVLEDKTQYFRKAIKKLAAEGWELDRSLFFSRLNTLYREFLVYKWIPEALTFTLDDAKKYQKQKEFTQIIDSFQEAYYYEFKNWENIDEVKKKSISDFESLL